MSEWAAIWFLVAYWVLAAGVAWWHAGYVAKRIEEDNERL